MNKQKYTDAITALETSAQLHKDAMSYSQRAIKKAQEAVKLFAEAEKENDTLTVSEEKTTVQVNGKYTLLDDKGLHIFSTPDNYRKHIVEIAKEEIDGLESRSVSIMVGHLSEDVIERGFDPFKGDWTRARFDEIFHVNKEKRTVVCLLVGHKTRHVYSRGIAKCDPNDVFNEYLGKIIAYYRAAKEEVPEIFTNVPNPEKIKNGDFIKYTKAPIGEYEVIERHSENIATVLGLKFGIVYNNHDFGRPIEEIYKIIDDSNRK